MSVQFTVRKKMGVKRILNDNNVWNTKEEISQSSWIVIINALEEASSYNMLLIMKRE
jgi:hypothetical protein